MKSLSFQVGARGEQVIGVEGSPQSPPQRERELVSRILGQLEVQQGFHREEPPQAPAPQAPYPSRAPAPKMVRPVTNLFLGGETMLDLAS